MFEFFLQSYRKGILTFSGTDFDVVFDPNSYDGKYTIRKFENGDYKGSINTLHPNIVYGVIKGKKSWGLWVQQWSDGIVDWTFTIDEIKEIFTEKNIKIPDPLWKDFLNVVEKKKYKRNIKYFNELNKH
jgi:hypothetical protein